MIRRFIVVATTGHSAACPGDAQDSERSRFTRRAFVAGVSLLAASKAADAISTLLNRGGWEGSAVFERHRSLDAGKNQFRDPRVTTVLGGVISGRRTPSRRRTRTVFSFVKTASVFIYLRLSMPNSLSVAGWNSRYKELGAKPAGFWGGLWHGIIAPITFVVSLFVDGVSIYETTNNGRWYEFGFMLGIGAYAGSEAAKPLQKHLLSSASSLTLALFPCAKVSIRARRDTKDGAEDLPP